MLEANGYRNGVCVALRASGRVLEGFSLEAGGVGKTCFDVAHKICFLEMTSGMTSYFLNTCDELILLMSNYEKRC